MAPELLLCEDLEDAARVALERIRRAAAEALETSRHFKLCLDGGRPTQALLKLLAADSGFDLARTELFLGDDRRVPTSDPRSNRGMVERLLPPGQLAGWHAPDGANPDPEAAASDFEAVVRKQAGEDGFDFLILGMGPDGHTASLFPRSPHLKERERWAVAADAPTTVDPKVPRLTLTPPALLRSKALLLFAVGAEKRAALARLMAPEGDERETPARLIWRYPGVPLVLADRAALA